MKRPLPLLLAVLLAALPLRPAAADAIHLSDLSGWDIVVAADAIASERKAAEEFQHFYERASGLTLPIVTTIDRPDRHVFVGPSPAMAESDAGFGVEGMGDEALRIMVTANNIAIAGGRPRGTLYGVYTFLENHLGVRFLTSQHTHVPSATQAPPLEPLDFSYDPPIVFRWSYWHDVNEFGDFAARTRNNGAPKFRPDLGGVSKYQLINHSTHHYIRTRDYGAEHPEYFAWVDGERRATPSSNAYSADSHVNGTQLCMTNPDVINLLTEKLLEKLRDEPGTRLIQIGQGDNLYYCRCETCAAIDRREGTHMGALLTGINQIAENIESEFPEVLIGTLAYKYSRKPPQTFGPRDNVQIQLCSIECSVTKVLDDPTSARNREFMAELETWSEKAKHLSIWTYDTNFWEFTLLGPLPQVVAPNIKIYFDHGVTQFFVQGNSPSPGGAFGELTNYVASNMMWDPSRDGDALIDEFLTLHYGKAGEPIRAFLDKMQANVEAKKVDQLCYGRGADFGIDNALIKAGFAAYEEAMSLAEDDEVKRRLDLLKLWLSRSAMEDAWAAIDPRKVKPGKQPHESVAQWMERAGHKAGSIDRHVQRRTRPHIREMFRLTDEYEVTHWREGWSTDHVNNILRHGFGLAEGEAW